MAIDIMERRNVEVSYALVVQKGDEIKYVDKFYGTSKEQSCTKGIKEARKFSSSEVAKRFFHDQHMSSRGVTYVGIAKLKTIVEVDSVIEASGMEERDFHEGFKVGDTIRYNMVSGVKIVDEDEVHFILEDRKVNRKKVYKDLVNSYGKFEY